MTKIIAVKAGPMQLTNAGKLRVAESMYDKGISFLAAAVLLEESKGQGWAVLHLLCQGLEIILKSFLLRCDYDKYWPQLKKRFRHDLVKVADEASTTFELKAPSGELRVELERLNKFYERHLLRYGAPSDIVIDPASIPVGRVFRRTVALVRLSARYDLSDGESSVRSLESGGSE